MRRLLSAVAAMAFGTSIYLVYGPRTLFAFDWLPGLSGISSDGPPLPAWMRHNLPDGLWAYAATLLLSLPWRRFPLRGETLFWIGLPFAFIFLSEFGQLLGSVPGTFDLVDLFAYTLGTAAAFLQIRHESLASSNPFARPLRSGGFSRARNQ
ncbi:hypothetical protein EON81_13990 [bacterium]|nr:MAG: hypothetical protein EON81_13990 [bacterium]